MSLRFAMVALLSLLASQSPAVLSQCAGTYQEPGGIFTWTFFGNADVRTDGACAIAGGYLTCINGFNAPVTLYPDATCNTITTSFSWLIFNRVGATLPQTAISSLLAYVNALYRQGVLNSGQANSLSKELNQILKLIQAGKINGALENLQQFLAEVNDLLSSGVLSQAQAAVLTSGANVVIGKLTLPPAVYVSNRSGNAINVVDVSTGTTQAVIAGVPKPQLMAFSNNGQSLYATTYDSNGPVYVVSAATNTISGSIPVGTSDHGLAFTPDGTRLYVTNLGSGTLSVISAATNTVIDTVTIGGYPTDVAITPDGAFAYVTDAFQNVVRVVEIPSGAVDAVIPVGSFPIGIAASPDNQWIYVANDASGTVSVIRHGDNTVVRSITVGPQDWALAVTPDGSRVYVTSEASANVWTIDSATWATSNVAVGVPTSGLAITRDGRHVYAGSKTGALIQIDTSTNAATVAATGLGEAVAVAIPPG